MRYNDKGPSVAAAQEKLVKLGYELPRFGVDGHLGDETWDALKRFTRDENDEIKWDPEVPDGVIESLHERTEPLPNAPPAGAVLEINLSPLYALYDVSHLLPVKGAGYPPRTEPIEKIWVHHTAAFGAAGYQGCLNHANFMINHRAWASGAAYTFWLSTKPDMDLHGRSVIYRMNGDHVISTHTGGHNATSGSVAFQGDFSDTEPAPIQVEMAEQLLGYCVDRYNLELPDGIGYHSEVADKVCPGDWIAAWVEAFRETGG